MPQTTGDVAVLWARVYAAFMHHQRRLPPQDATAQAALDRVAAKVQHQTPQRRSFNPVNCTIREEPITLEGLRALKSFRGDATPPPRCNDPTIIILDCGDGKVIVDGNKRRKQWDDEGKAGNWTAIYIQPRDGKCDT